MNKRKRKTSKRQGRKMHFKASTHSERLINPNAAGIDISATGSFVAVPPDRDSKPVQEFGCFTEDLHALADWLTVCDIDSVAMESTGVYWIPLFEVLESRGFDLYLVNARHVKNVPGRKTDVLDCQWLQELHTFGLLSASFRPDDEICVLRSYCRQRDNLISCASSHIQHMQKALEQMNVQLHKVISDITGDTGMRIIAAILGGERNRVNLAQLKDYRCKNDTKTIAKALDGNYRNEHVFALKQAYDLYLVYRQSIVECDREIEQYIAQLGSVSDPSENPYPKAKRSRKRPGSNEVSFDLRSHLYRISGVDFTAVDGLEASTAFTILSEVGLDPDRFRTMKHFTSWLCLCPDNRITGGKVKSSKTRKTKNRATTAFRLAARAAGNSLGPLGTFYRRIKSRLGAPKAITATAHKLARIFYKMWKSGLGYKPEQIEYHEKMNQERTIKYLRKKAISLGFNLVSSSEEIRAVS